MFFKNTETGLTWEVIDETHIKRCENDPIYEKVEEKKEPPKNTTSKTPKKKTTNK